MRASLIHSCHCSDSAGNVLIVWQESPTGGLDTDVFGRFYSVSGETASDIFLINQTTTDSQSYPAVSLADDGSFVVAFTNYSGLTRELKGVKGGTHPLSDEVK